MADEVEKNVVTVPERLPVSAGTCCADGVRTSGKCVCAYQTECPHHGTTCWGSHE